MRILALGGDATGVPTYLKYLVDETMRGRPPDQWVLFSDRPVSSVPAEVLRRRFGVPWLQMMLPRALERSGVTLLHGPSYALPGRGRFKRVVTFHDLGFLLDPSWVDDQVAVYLRRMVPHALKAADAVIVPSTGVREDIRRLYPQFKTLPIEVITLGSRFAPNPPARRATTEQPYILHVGTIEPRKNLHGLLRAFARLVAEGLPHRLYLVGRMGWKQEHFAHTLKELELGARVRLFGHVADQELAALYASAALYVQPSFHEGFGIGTLDAFVCGLPIAATRTGWAADARQPGMYLAASSRVQDLGAAMLQAIAGPAHFARSAQDHTWAQVASAHWRLYEQISG